MPPLALRHRSPYARAMTADVLDRIVTFLRQVGIAVSPQAIAEATFLPAIRIHDGTLRYDPMRLEWPGDLLHEAGHIAVTDPASRATLCEVDSDGIEETAAIAWSYAAMQAIGLASDIVFHVGGYRGGAARLAQTFDAGVFIGLPLLQQFGMTFDPAQAAARGVDPYPAMQRWLR